MGNIEKEKFRGAEQREERKQWSFDGEGGMQFPGEIQWGGERLLNYIERVQHSAEMDPTPRNHLNIKL